MTTTDALTLCGLTKVYANGFSALKGVDLSVKQGDFFALLGPNGAGKTTLIGIISSLVNKTAGTVAIFGYDTLTDSNSAKRCIGLVPQEMNFSIFEPIEQIVLNQAGFYGLPRRLARERAELCLKQLELWDKRKVTARALSGGMKRRLMIARALVHQPKLLILDEPTAGVDIEIRRSMWAFLRKINQQGTTIILTTHYLEEAENLCRTIAIIDHGQIIQSTSMRSLLDTLQFETLVFYLASDLLSVPQLPEYACRLVDSRTLEVDVAAKQGMNALFTQLSAQGIVVVSMKNKANRLEELFIKLTEKVAVNDD